MSFENLCPCPSPSSGGGGSSVTTAPPLEGTGSAGAPVTYQSIAPLTLTGNPDDTNPQKPIPVPLAGNLQFTAGTLQDNPDSTFNTLTVIPTVNPLQGCPFSVESSTTGTVNCTIANGAGATAVHGNATAGTGASVGVRGEANSASGIGVEGESSGTGVRGITTGPSENGVVGVNTSTGATGTGVLGSNGGSPGAFGVFSQGNMHADGDITASGTKSFAIPHPTLADTQLLHHAVEAPIPFNVYKGIVELDTLGEAEIVLPDYFEDINTDYTYQLTALGVAITGLFVSEEIGEVTPNTFKIAGGLLGNRVSWMVMATRNDDYIQNNPPETVRPMPDYPDIPDQE